jgi:coenzyme F420-reducing hydrogenase beta subunit
MKDLENKGPDELSLEVLRSDLCTVCGMCVGLCPRLKEMEERVVLLERCIRSEGRCYKFCPRTPTDLDALDSMVFGEVRKDPVLGSFRALMAARSTDSAVQAAGQYGGAVSQLVIQAMESGLVDAALLTGTDPDRPALPVPVVARTREEVLACAGSKYTAAPTLQPLYELLEQGARVAVVGRPCQVAAVRKMQRHDDSPHVKNLKLVIGLFCLWALDYRKLAGVLPDEAVRKFDIPKDDDFIVTTEKGQHRIAFDRIKEISRSTCELCYDVTAELADVSVGSTEWKDDYNTVLARSRLGDDLVRGAQSAGIIEVMDFPAERKEILVTAVTNKKKRVLKELSSRGGDDGMLLYLKMNDEQKKVFVEEGAE